MTAIMTDYGNYGTSDLLNSSYDASSEYFAADKVKYISGGGDFLVLHTQEELNRNINYNKHIHSERSLVRNSR
jgi:hypothetical protein